MSETRFHRKRKRVRSKRSPSGCHVRRRSRGDTSRRQPAYQNRIALLTRGEAAFFGPLCRALDGRFLVMCKVRLADIVTCSDDNWRRGWGAAIAQKHLDFVLCDVRTTRFVLAIELDDRSHARPDRRRRDRFVNQVLAQGGVQLIRVRASAWYSVASIRERILHRLHGGSELQCGSIQRQHPDARSIG